MPDVLGQAIYDHYFNLKPGRLLIHNKFAPPDVMPVETYFRNEEDMPELELTALQLCKGKVLDIGAGAGSHALYLQSQHIHITALELSGLACDVMRKRGVAQVINNDVYQYSGTRYDTLLMLMNGIGLTGNLNQLHTFMSHIKLLLKPGGQVLFDSSNVAYLYNGKVPVDNKKYYGEIDFRYEYKRQKTPWFTWLYIDKVLMDEVAGKHGFTMEVLFEDSEDQYLARLTKSSR